MKAAVRKLLAALAYDGEITALARRLANAEAANDRQIKWMQQVRRFHKQHVCDGDPADCLCADDVAEQGGPVCAHCRTPWPCLTATLLDRALEDMEAHR
jgi:hypothetical protein